MSRRIKPGPKSSKRSQKAATAAAAAAVADLGDSSSDDYNDNATFYSPESSPNRTHYNLRYENENTPRLPLRQSIATAATRSAEQPSTSNRGLVRVPSRKITQQVKPPRRRKQTTPAQRNRKFFKEVRQLQSFTGFLIPRLPFSRLVRELLMFRSQSVQCITREAFDALQTAAEMYLTQQFEDAYMLTLHRNRITLSVIDLRFLRHLFSKINLHQ